MRRLRQGVAAAVARPLVSGAVIVLLGAVLTFVYVLGNRPDPTAEQGVVPAPEAVDGGTGDAPQEPGDAADDPGAAADPDAVVDPVGDGEPSSEDPSDGGMPLEEIVPDTELVGPVPLEQPTDFGNAVEVVLTRVERVEVEARGPGQVAGPSIRVQLGLTNGSGEELDLSAVVVNLYAPDGTPGAPMEGSADGFVPLTGALLPGATAVGTYTLRLPDGVPEDAALYLTVGYDADVPTVVFEGEVRT